MSVLDNPRAFPSAAIDDQFGGMTLRDWFAGMATEADIEAHRHLAWEEGHPYTNSRESARYAYADAMLAERGEADRNYASYLAFLKERKAEGRDQ